MSDKKTRREAVTFTNYLIGKKPNRQSIELYGHFVARDSNVSMADERILAFSIAHPQLLPYLDSGLGLLAPESTLRRRIYGMLAILETDPKFSDCFLPISRNFFYVFVAALYCGRAASRSVIGVLLVKAVRSSA